MNKLIILGAIVAGLVVVNRKAQRSASASPVLTNPVPASMPAPCGCSQR